MRSREQFMEGDTNNAPLRASWYTHLNAETGEWLNRDNDVFIHQSLSTPCLNVVQSCNGIYITDISGRQYMDFHGNNVHQVGYANKYVIEKVKQQLEVLPFSPRRYSNKPAIELAEKLASLMPGELNRVLYATGGTNAVGIALKIAKRVTGKHKVISMAGSFHGASLDAIAAGGELQFKKYMGTLSPESINIPQTDYYRHQSNDDINLGDVLEEKIKEDSNICAFLAETIRNTDVQVPSAEYWKRIREICTKHNILLIVDEIPIAFGRTGKMFAFEHFGFEPDVVCLGKGLGSGIIPLAAVITRDEYNIAGDVSFGHFTHEKNPLGCVAALAMLEYIEKENLFAKTIESEFFLREKLLQLKEKFNLIGDVRGIGLLWAIELVKDRKTKARATQEAEQVMYECLKNGLSFKVSKGNVLQWCPPLIITKDELQAAVNILENALLKVS